MWICDVNGNALSLSQPIRHLLLLFVICADFFAIGLYLSIGLGPEEDYTERDFMAFYAASRLPYNETYEADKQRELQERIKQKPFEVFVNPPFIVPIFKAVMDDHYIRSYKRWVGLLAVLSLICGVLIYLIFRHSDWERFGAGLAASTAMLALPIYISVVRGQLTIIMLLGSLLSILFLQRNRDALAGIGASLCFVKPHTALILAMSLTRRSRTIKYLLLTLLLLGVLSVAIVGLKGISDLVHLSAFISDYNAGGASQSQMFNLLGLLLRLGVPFGWAKSVAWLAFGLAITVGAISSIRARDPLMAAGVCTLLAVPFSPHLHIHDIGLLVIPGCALANNLKQKGFSLGVSLLPLLPLLPFMTIFILPAG